MDNRIVKLCSARLSSLSNTTKVVLTIVFISCFILQTILAGFIIIIANNNVKVDGTSNCQPPNDNADGLNEEMRNNWLNYRDVDITKEKDTILAKNWNNYEDNSIYSGNELDTSKFMRVVPGAKLETIPGIIGTENFTYSYYVNKSNHQAPPSPPPVPCAIPTIEEPDIIKLVGSQLYVLNPYRGLYIINVTDPRSPSIIGNAKVLGYPVEMYVVDFLVFIVVNTCYNYLYKYRLLNNGSDPNDFKMGSRIVVVNVLDPKAPIIAKTVPLNGYTTDTRRVGEIIYAVTNTYSWCAYYDGQGENQRTYVTSLNFKDPNNVYAVDNISFCSSTNKIHVTPNAIYVAQVSDEYKNHTYEYRTKVVYIDITDRDGLLRERGNFTAEGYLYDKYQMNYFESNFRMVTHFWANSGNLGSSTLWVYNVIDPDNIAQLSRLDIADAGNLMATRFEGTRAYTIHLPHSVDPLDVIDLSNPKNPVLCSMLEMPGWVTYMDVRGYKILALGVDDSTGVRKVALSIFDVTDPYKPILKSRVAIGNGSSWSGANFEPKCLSIIDDSNLVLVPFTVHQASSPYKYAYGLQIIKFDLNNDTLTLCSSVEVSYPIERTRMSSSWIFCMSQTALQVIDAADICNAILVTNMNLYSYIIKEIELNQYLAQLVYDSQNGNIGIRTVPFSDPNSLDGLAYMGVTARWANMFAYGTDIVLIYESRYYYDKRNVSLLIIDYSDPLKPAIRSGLTITNIRNGYSSMWTYQIDDLFVICAYSYDYDVPQYLFKMCIINLSNPNFPVISSYIVFPIAHYYSSPIVEGKVLYVVYERTDFYSIDNWTYLVIEGLYMRRIDFSNEYRPVLLKEINIPGEIIGAESSSNIFYCTCSYDESSGMWLQYEWKHRILCALVLNDSTATLFSAIKFDRLCNCVLARSGFVIIQNYTSDYYLGAAVEYLTFVYFSGFSPVLLKSYELDIYCRVYGIEYGYLIVDLCGSDGMLLININDIFNIKIDKAYLLYYNYYQIILYDNEIHIICGRYGVQVIGGDAPLNKISPLTPKNNPA